MGQNAAGLKRSIPNEDRWQERDVDDRGEPRGRRDSSGKCASSPHRNSGADQQQREEAAREWPRCLIAELPERANRRTEITLVS